jgi:hypothetical protein
MYCVTCAGLAWMSRKLDSISGHSMDAKMLRILMASAAVAVVATIYATIGAPTGPAAQHSWYNQLSALRIGEELPAHTCMQYLSNALSVPVAPRNFDGVRGLEVRSAGRHTADPIAVPKLNACAEFSALAASNRARSYCQWRGSTACR